MTIEGPDPVVELMGTLAAQDDRLRARIIALANRAMDEAEFMLDHGDPLTKRQLVRSFMAVFAKSMEARDKDEEMEYMKTGLAELTKAVLGRRPGEVILEIEAGDAVEDLPNE